MISEGRVALDGVALTTPATVLPSLRGVTVDGVAVMSAAPARLFLFHKPPGVLTTAIDPRGRATFYDRLPSDLPREMPGRRLDLATEGLLLLTTDGELKRELELPATGVERAYRARAYGDVTQAQLEELIEGIEIEGIRYGAIDANLERRTGANVWIELILTEGKNREVRRVLEYLGLQVSRLIRTRYGPFILGDMPAGAVGEVRQHDLVAFRKTLGKPGAKADVTPVVATPYEARPKRQAKVVDPEAPPPAGRSAPSGGAGHQRPDRPASGEFSPRAAPAMAKPARAAAPRKREVREEIDTRPQREPGARSGPSGRAGRPAPSPRRAAAVPVEAKPRDPAPARQPPAASDRPQRPVRKAGWAKAKPKPGNRPKGKR